MKRKLLFSALLVTAGLLNASAQTDVTSTYLTNADFSSTDGWTQNHSSQYWALGNGLIGTYVVANNYTSTTDATHLDTEYCLGIQCRWNTNYAAFQQTKENASLEAGTYTVTFDVQNTNTATAANANYENLFYVKVGDNTYYDSATEWKNSSPTWTAHTISFVVDKAMTANVTFSFGYVLNTNNGTGATPHIYVSHLKITWSADPLKAAKDALQAEIDKAKLCDAKEGLADAISAAESALASATTKSELEEALTALQTADKDAVLRYENGLADATYAAPVVTDFVVNGTFTDNVSGWTCTGGFQNQTRASNQSGAFTVPFFENWNGSAKVNKMYQTISNIPNGTYRLDIAAFVNTLADPNESQYVFANDDKVYLTTGTPTAYEVYTVVTDNQVEIGLEQTTATANWMGIDNVSLRYYGAGDVINAAKNAGHKLAWEEAKAAAEAAIVNGDYANVLGGSEETALQTEIDKAEPSTADDYDAAAAALASATSTFIAAKGNYDIFATYNIDLSYADPAKKPAITSESTAASIITALRAYYESNAIAEGVEGKVDYTSVVAAANADTNTGWTNGIGTNTNEGYTDADGNVCTKYLDGGWSSSAGANIDMTREVVVPAGRYLLTVTARGASDLTQYTLSIAGETVDLPKLSSTGGIFGRGWNDVSLEFESDGSAQTLEVIAKSTAYYQWISINRFRLVQLEEIVVPMADTDDYAALAAAISTAETNKLGFEDGKYAPYNNVAALTALAAAKAIDPQTDNLQKVVQNAITALTSATWTPNDGDVDAIYNGLFATVAEGANYPDGWTRTNAWGQMQTGLSGDYATAYYNQPGSLKYGENGVYTMPLAANTWYKLSFAYRSHENNSNKGVTASVLNEEGEGLDSYGFPENGSTSVWKTAEVGFKTGAAGNYVLTLANGGNTWMTNVSLVKAETTDVTMVVSKAQYATFVAPFDVTIPAGVDAYTISGFEDGSDKVLKLDEVDTTIPANTPVVLFSESAAQNAVNETFTGVAVYEGASLTYGWLTGVYEETQAENTWYVLQSQNGKVGFYEVLDIKPSIPAYRAYLTKPAGAKERAFFFDGDATAIEAVSAIAAGEIEAIYTTGGVQVQSLQKGMNIVVLKNGKTQKVFVK